jgi:competence protein ComEC
MSSITLQAKQLLCRYLPLTHCQLVSGMIFGVGDDFSASLQSVFQAIGLLHIVSASGFNVGLIGQLVRRVVGNRVPRPWLGGLLLVSIGAYTALSSGGVSVQRAAVMLALSTIARYWCLRQYRARWSWWLTLVGLLVFDFGWAQRSVMWRGWLRDGWLRGRGLTGWSLIDLFASLSAYLTDPDSLVHSLSFQLSFAATWAVIWLYPRLQQLWTRYGRYWHQQNLCQQNLCQQSRRSGGRGLRRLKASVQDYMSDTLLITVAVQLVLIPLLLHYFGQLSLISPLANLLLLWLVPLLTVGGLLWLLVAILLTGAGQLMGLTGLGLLQEQVQNQVLQAGIMINTLILWLPSETLITGAKWLAGWPGMMLFVERPSWNFVFIWWALLMVGVESSYWLSGARAGSQGRQQQGQAWWLEVRR